MGILEDVGTYRYLCPHCRESLVRDEGIEFKVIKSTQDTHIIYLDPTLGKYEYTYDYTSIFFLGEQVDFFCPVCSSSLHYTKNKEYVKVIMSVSKYVEFDVLFSSIYGKHKTYLVDENFVESFGVDNNSEFFDL